MSTRVIYRRKHTYKTRSNVSRRFRTPGGRLIIQNRNKRISRVVCGDTGLPLNGITRVHAAKFKSLPRRKRTVTRAYGGSLSHQAVAFRIKRAFFNEELKLVKANAAGSRKQAKKQHKKK